MLWFFQWSCMDVRVGLWRKLTAEELMLLESSLDWKEIQSVHPKGNQSWIFIGRTDAEAEAPILWPPDAKNQLIGKHLDAGKDWRQEEKGMTQDEMVGWHHWLYVHEFEQAPGDGEGQGGLACCSPRSAKESDTTEQPNNNKYLETLPHFCVYKCPVAVCLLTTGLGLSAASCPPFNGWILPFHVIASLERYF